MVAHSDTLIDRFMFNFHITVAGKIASARSENELTALDGQRRNALLEHIKYD